MPPIKRRHFLQATGSTLATIGLSQWAGLTGNHRLAQVLAQATPRKLALLVGINTYPSPGNLQGCTTDVRLQQELLVHRFGFQPADILTVTDGAATRQGILDAFEQHLIQQAQPGDVVVFHYSGHGSRVLDPDPVGAVFNSTFVPVDSPIPIGGQARGESVPDIMGKTLFLLMSALATENVAVVLDSCYSGGGKRGTTVVRSIENPYGLPSPAEAELAYQAQWLRRLRWTAEEFKQRRSRVAKGVVVASAGPGQLALDANFGDFHAGAFTYLMTRYLWQQVGDEPMKHAIANIGRSTQSYAQTVSNRIQAPNFETNLPTTQQDAPLFFVMGSTPPAEAVITAKTDKTVQLWLGGVDPQNLVAYGPDTVFTVVDARGQAQGQVRLLSRQGLEGQGELLGSRTIGDAQFLQEEIRGVPQDLVLRIGLDPSLGEATASARDALSQMNRITPVNLSEPGVDYLLGYMTPEYQTLQTPGPAPLPPVGSLGLFLPGQDLIPGSFGAAQEPLSAAIQRLDPKLKLLLATRVLKLMLNPSTSRLNLVASMRPVGASQVIGSQAVIVRGTRSATAASTEGDPVEASRLPIGTEIQFRIQNHEPRDLFISIVVITPGSDMLLIFPNNWSAPENAALVRAGETLNIPELGRDRFRLRLREPVGIVETLVIASAVPLRDALRVMGEVGTQRQISRGSPLGGDGSFLAIADTLLSDLNRSATASLRGLGIQPRESVQGIDTHDVAAFSITFEITNP